MKKITIGIAMLMLSACASVTESGYYWGDYSHTYYDYIKAPSVETAKLHMDTLEDIVAVSAQKGLKVPPGIYAEMGYILLKDGKQELGQQMLAKETELYPESSVFVSGLLKG